MLFNSPRMQKFLQQFANTPDYYAPRAVYLARTPELINERAHLEDVIQLAPRSKQKSWENDLMGKDDGNFLGTWFEIELSDSLRQQGGNVTISPRTEGNDPDFAFSTSGYPQEVIIEAKARLRSPGKYKLPLAIAGIRNILEKYQLPYHIFIEDFQLGTNFNLADFDQEVSSWLSSDEPETTFTFTDQYKTKIILEIDKRDCKSKNIQVGDTGSAEWIGSSTLEEPLDVKALQHPAIYKAGHPYVIAILLDDPELSAEEVADAWFGSEAITYNPQTIQITGILTHDKTGLHFSDEKIKHTNVSGTLVYKIYWDEASGRHYLKAWYIENPFADVPIPTNLFKVEDAYIAINRDPQNLKMQWQSKTSQKAPNQTQP